MTKWILSRYNHDVSYLPEYTEDYVMYDRSEIPIDDPRVIKVPNIGTDLYDKFTFIIDNYDDLPEVALYTKANIFKYISKEELDRVKDNKTFTPLLTQNHRTYDKDGVAICFYEDGLYFEINNQWYLNAHPCRTAYTGKEVADLMGISDLTYVPFAPGSNYILSKENISQHSKEFYEKLRSYLSWAVYPGEAQIMERGLFNLWRTA